MAWCPDGNELDQQLFDAMAEFFGMLAHRGDKLAEQFGVPVFCLKALHRLGTPTTLKDLGKQLHVDPSFVTVIADTLEANGLARREPNPADRRLKNLVLTPGGLALKHRLEGMLTAQMPWSDTLDMTERAQLLKLIRKMTKATAAAFHPPSPDEPAGEVSETTDVASLATT